MSLYSGKIFLMTHDQQLKQPRYPIKHNFKCEGEHMAMVQLKRTSMFFYSVFSLRASNVETLVVGLKVLASFEKWVQRLLLENDWN